MEIKDIEKIELGKNDILIITLMRDINDYDIDSIRKALKKMNLDGKYLIVTNDIRFDKIMLMRETIKDFVREIIKEEERIKKIQKKNFKSELYCFIMNIIDYRYWRCDCCYESPYGLVISADCKKHD